MGRFVHHLPHLSKNKHVFFLACLHLHLHVGETMRTVHICPTTDRNNKPGDHSSDLKSEGENAPPPTHPHTPDIFMFVYTCVYIYIHLIIYMYTYMYTYMYIFDMFFKSSEMTHFTTHFFLTQVLCPTFQITLNCHTIQKYKTYG